MGGLQNAYPQDPSSNRSHEFEQKTMNNFARLNDVFAAIRRHSRDDALRLYERLASSDEKDKFGRTALHEATIEGQLV
jgi:hypothetical protein